MLFKELLGKVLDCILTKEDECSSKYATRVVTQVLLYLLYQVISLFLQVLVLEDLNQALSSRVPNQCGAVLDVFIDTRE